MTAFDRQARRTAAVLSAVLVGALALGGCGASGSGTAAPSAQAPTALPATPTPLPATPAPTPKPAATPTATPAATATPAPAPSGSPADLGGFAFPPGDVLDYYVGLGFTCEDPQPSTQAADYVIVRCLKTETAGGPTALVALVVNNEGVTGDAFAGYVNPSGSEPPDQDAAFKHLAGFFGAMLGTEGGAEAATWLTANLGAESAQDTFGDILGGTYTSDDETGVGYYVEVTNQAFMNAPPP